LTLRNEYEASEKGIEQMVDERMKLMSQLSEKSDVTVGKNPGLREIQGEFDHKLGRLEAAQDALPGMREAKEKDKELAAKARKAATQANLVQLKIREAGKTVSYVEDTPKKVTVDASEVAQWNKDLEGTKGEVENLQKERRAAREEMEKIKVKGSEEDPQLAKMNAEVAELRQLLTFKTRDTPEVLAIRQKIKDVEDQYTVLRKQNTALQEEVMRRDAIARRGIPPPYAEKQN
jgi:chromosome segregation ATPase